MKTVSIITGSELRQIQGVNYFIKSLIGCNSLFKDVFIKRVYSSKQTLKIDEGDRMPIGNDIGTREYAIRTGIRSFLRKLLTDKFYPFALFRYELNYYCNSHNSAVRYFEDNIDSDYIIFQEIGCAYYYFKLLDNYSYKKMPKTALVIHSEDDNGSMLLNSFTGFGRRDMQKRFMKRRDYVYSHIDRVVYISRKAYNCSVLPECKKAIVYNGSPDFLYTFKDDAKQCRQFICVGSFAGRKGQEKIIEAMSLLDDTHKSKMHLTLVGDGPEQENVRNLSAQLHLDKYVTFLGRRNDIPEILKNKDVFIMPSLVEGLPMSAIEAMRAGLFLILTDTGGNVELCDDNCGIICTRDIENIKNTIIHVLDKTRIDIVQKQHSRNRFLRDFSLNSMAIGYEHTLLNI